MWEASRMLSSGVAQRIEVDTDFDEENEVKKKGVIIFKLLIFLFGGCSESCSFISS